MSLTLRTSKAVGWTTLAKIIQQVFQFALSVVLMRLLGPKSFGLIGMVLVFSGFAGIFRELGFTRLLGALEQVHNQYRDRMPAAMDGARPSDGRGS